MDRGITTTLVSACLAVGGCAQRPPAPAPGPTDAGLRTALALAIGLLETRDYRGYVERFLPPAELEGELRAGRSLDDLVRWVLHDPDRQLARLRQVRGSSPAFHDGGATAVFEAARGG